MALVSIGCLVALGVAAGAFNLTEGRARYWAVALGVSGAVASVLLTLRDYGSKAAAHRTASRQYGALRREIEQLVEADLPSVEAFELRITEIRRRWDWTADVAPNAPVRIRKKAEKSPRPLRYVGASRSDHSGLAPPIADTTGG